MRVLIITIILFFGLVWLEQSNVQAQLYNFNEIKENLLLNRPHTGDFEIRRNSICSIDDLVFGRYDVNKRSDFYRMMLQKAMIEIKTEKVTNGVTVWQIYNHGFIVKTPSLLIGFDLYDHYGSIHLEDLADSLDVLFISHNHSDHISPKLNQALKNLNKPAIRSINDGLSPSRTSTSINLGDSINKLILKITQHKGLHSVHVNMYEVVTPEGYKIFHTGDNQTSATLPRVDGVDILLLNAWVDGSRPINSINTIKPKVTLPGHILELGHLGGYIVPYSDVFYVNEIDLESDYYVLAWGERYHYENASNDSIRPNSITNPEIKITNDSVKISWSPPEFAIDGEAASFYRIIRNGSKDIFSQNTSLSFVWDSIETYPMKIHSYDACGNQSEMPLEFNVTIPKINYSPRINKIYPAYQDTIDVFQGVYKVFGVEASDPNNDSLYYYWELDDKSVQLDSSSRFVYNTSQVDSGIHYLTLTVSDNNLSRKHSWCLNHHDYIAIIDDSDYLMYSESGNWGSYDHSSANNGSLRFSYLTNIGDWAQFSYYPEKHGYYDIEVHVPNIPSGSGRAYYFVLIDEFPIDTIIINQISEKGNWVGLGQYYFQNSDKIKIKVVNTMYTGIGVSLMVDAVKLKYAGPSSGILEQDLTSANLSKLECFPNPFKESTTLVFNNIEGYPYTLYIFNSVGSLIRVEENIVTSNYTFFKKQLKAGFYTVVLKGPKIYKSKIVIQ